MFLLLLIVFTKGVLSTYGCDLSQPCSAKGFECLKGYGYKFAIIRCYQSSGHTDVNCPDTVAHAWAGGMEHVDVYLFPDPKKGGGAAQVNDTVNYLNQHGSKYGMLWLDIEGTQYWLGDKNKNRAFFEELLDGIKQTGIKAGIYASYYQWESIFGLDYTGGVMYPLWYAHYDNDPSFKDFKPFSGWSKPAMKQYKGTTQLCGCGIDKNWYP